MERTESLVYSNKWIACLDGYEIKDIDYENPPAGYNCYEEGYCLLYFPVFQMTKLIVPKSDKWREYEFPLPQNAIWSFLGHVLGGSNGDPKGKFLSDEELLKWIDKYGIPWGDPYTYGFALEQMQFEQKLFVAVFRLLERYSEPERKDDGFYYVDGVQLDGWDTEAIYRDEGTDVIPNIPDGIEVDMNLIAAQYVLRKKMNVQIHAYPKIIASEGVIRIEKTLSSSLLGNLWVDLLEVLFGEESKTARCIFCGNREIIKIESDKNEPLKSPSRGISGYYHQRCRDRVWKEGKRHPERQGELNRKYGLKWGSKERKA